MDSTTRRNIFLYTIIIFLVVVVIWYYRKTKADKSSKNDLVLADVPKEVLAEVVKVDAEEVSKKAPDKNSFPLELGSTGENVVKLQTLLKVKNTGTLDKDTLSAFKKVTDGIGLVNNNKVSQASILLLENYTKSVSQYIVNIGDTVYANLPKVVIERVNVKRDKNGNIGKLQPTRDYKGFTKDNKIGIVTKLINETQALIKNEFGDYFIVKLDAIIKR